MPLDEKGLGTVVGVLVASTGLTALRLVGHSIAGALKRPGLACGALIKKNRPKPNSQKTRQASYIQELGYLIKRSQLLPVP